ncbi:beta-1,4-galactosyltransferase 4-like [Gigantopelta aegis]|uniref:beta-1,4-galactosyltransferase 4-like n=1 Tax=Gigantopelta aegis TaxID=1735272 RepID=UPI001B88DAF1|nr:beta-1,4-galactosyltransferase 4-like [Gigantopelta aegis]XP_041376374.1 beta-1,4-galactosyltransferase 4-like [Gigantopelta aegis]
MVRMVQISTTCKRMFLGLVVISSVMVVTLNYLKLVDVHGYMTMTRKGVYTLLVEHGPANLSRTRNVDVNSDRSSLDSTTTQLPLTTHTTQLPLTTHITQLQLTTHTTQVSLTTHTTQLPLTTHTTQLPLTTNTTQLSLTTHTTQLKLTTQKTISLCPEKPANYGKGTYFPITFDNITLHDLKLKYKPFDSSGRFKPPDCLARKKVAVIVPYRDRERHLYILLNNLIPFLLNQQTEFTIFVIEQTNDTIFNRGLLLNVGFVEALKQDNYSCFIMHDVDSMPEVNDNLYRCSSNPVHMSTASSKNKFKLPYRSYTGGIVGFTKEQYEKINGFSNRYFGWGGEDDDVEIRIKHKSMRVERLPYKVGRYQAIPHEPDKGNPPNPNKGKLFRGLTKRIPTDGFSSLHYTSEVQHKQLYTWILVHINMTFHEVKIS